MLLSASSLRGVISWPLVHYFPASAHEPGKQSQRKWRFPKSSRDRVVSHGEWPSWSSASPARSPNSAPTLRPSTSPTTGDTLGADSIEKNFGLKNHLNTTLALASDFLHCVISTCLRIKTDSQVVFQVKTHAEIFLLNRPPVPQTAIVLAIEVVKVVMVLAVLVLRGKAKEADQFS